MKAIKVEDPGAARAYLSEVSLYGRSADYESADALELPLPAYEDGTEQVVTVGSQIAEFSSKIPAEKRPQIANSFLLAQLAANRTVAQGGATREWYDRYVAVLANIGWLIETEVVSTRDVTGSSAVVHEEIIPVIAAALGPAVAAAALVTKLLQGLANMDKDSPWITLFSQESERAKANQFQVSYADVPEGKDPRISLACFELDASRSVTQVLFFKFSKSNAILRHFGSHLSMNPAIFDKVQDVVEERVEEYVKNYISSIPV